MKKFVVKLLILIFCSTIVIASLYGVVAAHSMNILGIGSDVALSIDKSDDITDKSKVYLGDSVCNQLWSVYSDDDDVCHLGSNKAITPAGNYILLMTYLEYNLDTKEVFYMVRPQSLANDYWLDYTYQYFIYQFCEDDTIDMLETSTKDKIYKKFGKIFVENEFVKSIIINNSGILKIYLDILDADKENHIENRLVEESVLYIKKMAKECENREIAFYVLPLPLADTNENHNLEKFAKDILENGLEDIMGSYIDDIDYYPEDWFTEDGVHLTDEALSIHGNEIRENILGKVKKDES